MSVFDHLIYWNDVVPRKGSENMAVDQFLLERAQRYPILRVYQWSEPSISFGYFHKLEEVELTYPPNGGLLNYVRRWTGGGIVDHRLDLTYTLVVPRDFELGYTRGASSYRLIHQELCEALKKLGQNVQLSDDGRGSGSLCFVNPVAYDLTDQAGKKIAGAGQRRTKHGLLHQGSVHAKLDTDIFGEELAKQLATSHEIWHNSDSYTGRVAEIEADRYANEKWLKKR
jgi:lipoate-protein ligase A